MDDELERLRIIKGKIRIEEQRVRHLLLSSIIACTVMVCIMWSLI